MLDAVEVLLIVTMGWSCATRVMAFISGFDSPPMFEISSEMVRANPSTGNGAAPAGATQASKAAEASANAVASLLREKGFMVFTANAIVDLIGNRATDLRRLVGNHAAKA